MLTPSDHQIISLDHPNAPQLLLTLLPPADEDHPPTPSDRSAGVLTVTAVSWAPSAGRSYHLIATGTRQGLVRIWKVWPSDSESDALGAEAGKWSAQMVAALGDHKRCVTRVEWNSTGTVLSSSGDDGKVRMWKGELLS